LTLTVSGMMSARNCLYHFRLQYLLWYRFHFITS